MNWHDARNRRKWRRDLTPDEVCLALFIVALALYLVITNLQHRGFIQ